MLSITHTAAEGTLIEGTSRGDGTAEVLKASGWRWSRTLGSWYVPQSRDRDAKTWIIHSTADRLRAAGYDVEVDIDNTSRPTDQVEADRIERQEQRVDALNAKADRLAGRAAAADVALNAMPRYPLGQPILIGHHSEGRMRRDLARLDRAMRTAIDATSTAVEAAARADSAAATTRDRYNPLTVGNRIETLEADIRRLKRERDGHTRTLFTRPDGTTDIDTFPAATGPYRDQIQRRIDTLGDQVVYWRNVLKEAVKAGEVTLYDSTTVAAGDEVQVHGTWHVVVRANKRTVTLPTGYSWTQTVPYRHIRGHRRPPASMTSLRGACPTMIPRPLKGTRDD